MVTEQALNYLKSFLAIAHAGSIARASEAIHKASSAIARDVAGLEHLLDTRLFERQPRGMVLTAHGRVVLRRAERIEDEIETAVAEQRRQGDAGFIASLLLSGRKLRLLTALADQRQIADVAHRLDLSQAGVSMSLSRIEAGLGQPVFRRTARGLETTDLGVQLVLRAKRILAELRHMAVELSEVRGKLEGTIFVGALPLGRTLILPAAIAVILEAYPGLRVRTFESPYEVLQAGLREGDIDLIFGALRGDAAEHGLDNEALFTDRLSVVVRAGHPLSGRSALSLADLTGAGWVLPRIGSPARRSLEALFRRDGLAPPEPSVETGDLAIIRALLRSSDLVTAISPDQLAFEIQMGILEELPIRLDGTERRIGVMLRDNALPSPAVEALLAELRRAVSRHYSDRRLFDPN